MPYSFGQIVLVQFPFTNQVEFKQRPAVVVSSSVYNDSRPDVVLMAITSRLRSASTPDELWISDWQAANLLKASAIKPVFATFEQQLIVKSLGALQSLDQANLRAVIRQIFG